MTKEQNLEELAQEVGQHLRELRRVLRKPVEAEVARAGLTWPQRNVMQVLVNSRDLSLKELSKQVGLGHATVSGIVDRLEKRGLVERHRDPSDGRLTKIMISSTVRLHMRERWPALLIDPLQTALRRATAAERRTIRQGLKTLRSLVGDD